MKLKAWFQKTGNTPTWLCSKLGVSGPAVSRWVNGVTTPSLSHALAIERLTGGEVACKDWEDKDSSISIDEL